MDIESSITNLSGSAMNADSETSRPGTFSKLRRAAPQLDRLAGKRLRRRKLTIWAFAVDLICIAVAYSVTSYAWLDVHHVEQVSRILVSVLPIYLGISFNNRGHQTELLIDAFRSGWRAGTALAWAAATLLLVAFFMKIGAEFSRLVFGFGTVLGIVLVVSWRSVLARIANRYLGPSPFATLCIYDDWPRGEFAGEGALDASAHGLSPDPADPAAIDHLGRVVMGMDSVVVHCPPEKRAQWAFVLKSLDVPSEIVTPELNALHPLAIGQRSGQTSLVLTSGPMPWNQRLLKRSFDLLITLLLMPLLVPFIAVVALLIKFDSPGPVFFKQDRIGLGNRKFSIFKFRSMRTDMQDDRARKLTQRDDPRVTKFGKFIRSTSIDELPQFINVLRGDMSLVGPRPHAELALAGERLYWEVDNAYWHRHVVKPGITGLAQIRGHRGNTFDEQQLRDRLNADLEYVSEWSLISDMKILLRTISVVFHKNAF